MTAVSLLNLSDAVDHVVAHTHPRALLMLSMTCRHFHALADSPEFWTHIYHAHYSRPVNGMYSRRSWAELETKPRQHMLQKGARRICGLLEFQGCEFCGRRHIRKVYMPFLFRACQQCFLDLTIQERFLPRVTGFDSKEEMIESGVELGKLQVRTTWESNPWGSWQVKYYLREEVQTLFDHLKEGIQCPEMDHIATTRRLRAESSQLRRKWFNRSRRRLRRWVHVQKTLGVTQADLGRSPSLAKYVDPPPDQKDTPVAMSKALVRRIQTELWDCLYPTN